MYVLSSKLPNGEPEKMVGRMYTEEQVGKLLNGVKMKVSCGKEVSKQVEFQE